ncbi:N/A [soil metagenome]
MIGAPPAPRSLSLRRGAAWATVGNGIYFGCQYGMLAVLAKLGDATAVGQFALALALCAPIVVLSQMNLRQLQVTDVRTEVRFADYFLHRAAFSVPALLLIGAIASRHSSDVALVIGAVGVAKVLESVSDVIHGDLQRLERLDLVAVSLILKGGLSLLAMAVVMAATGSLFWATVGMAGAWLAILLGYDVPVHRRTTGGSEFVAGARAIAIRQLTRISAPLALTAGLISLSGNIPRYFLDALQGKEGVAIFAIAAAPLILANLVSGAVNQAALPRAARSFQLGDFEAFRRLALRLVGLNVLIGLGFALVLAVGGRFLIAALFTPDYVSAVPLMVVMSLGVSVGGLGAYGALVVSAGRRFTLQLYNVIVMVVLQLIVCYALIGSYGTTGAAWSEFLRYAGSAAFLLISGWVVYHSEKRIALANAR